MSGPCNSARALAALILVFATPVGVHGQLLPVPAITSLSPSVFYPNSGFTLIVYGRGFLQTNSRIMWNGQEKATQFVSSTQLRTIVTGLETYSAVGKVNVNNLPGTPLHGGGLSNTLSISNGAGVIATTTAIPLPLTPVIASTSPTSARAWDPSLTLTMTGSWFTPQSKIRVSGVERATTFISSSQLATQITSADLAGMRVLELSVFTPAPGGGTSSTYLFNVGIPVPIVTSLSPASIKGGSAGFTLTVNGSRFIPSTVVYWNGAPRPTTYVSDTKLTIPISADDVVRLTPPTDRTVIAGVYTKGGGRLQPITFTITKQ